MCRNYGGTVNKSAIFRQAPIFTSHSSTRSRNARFITVCAIRTRRRENNVYNREKNPFPQSARSRFPERPCRFLAATSNSGWSVSIARDEREEFHILSSTRRSEIYRSAVVAPKRLRNVSRLSSTTTLALCGRNDRRFYN